jgi:glutathione S-transferase
VRATLYTLQPSHPSHAARLMLEHKGIDYKPVEFPSGSHAVLLRTRGFRGATVPALKLDGRRVQTSRAISRALDEAQPEPRLFPADPEERIAVEEAERWGDQVLQPMPRRMFRWVTIRYPKFRAHLARIWGMPFPRVSGFLTAPVARYYARQAGSTDDRVRSTLAMLPAALDHVDKLIADGVIGGTEPNAADFQIGTSVRVLMTYDDLAPAIEGRAAGKHATALMAEYPNHVPAGYLPAGWLGELRG